MSIINKMLQDLDKRHAAPDPDAPAAPGPSKLAQQVRPVAVQVPSMGSNLFWRIMAGVMAVVVFWVIWLMWQLTPRSVVTDLALRSVGKARVTAPTPAAAPVPAAPPVAVASVPATAVIQPGPAVVQPGPAVVQHAPVPAAVPPMPAPAAPQPKPAAPSAPAMPTVATATKPSAAVPARPAVDMLRLATEIAAPIKSTGAKAQPSPRRSDKQTVAKVTEAPPVARDASSTQASDRPASSAAKSALRTHKAPALAVAPEAARIDKRVDATPRERAESGFRRAMGLVNQGRMAEGTDELNAALTADPSYEVARQTLVALFLEAKRTSEAAGLLRDGLAINPANVPYAMLLARIHVERGDPHGALALLQKSEPVARSNAGYQAFVAALYQRLGRHTEAVERYRSALRLSAGVGAWWVGLGISQEALSREQDATESFHRARGTGSLSPELLAYVDRRLKQLH